MMRQPLNPETENCIVQLLAVLDNDIVSLEGNLTRLDELRRLVIKQDTDSLTRLLETIRAEAGLSRNNELRRQSLRMKLAERMACELKETTLSKIEKQSPDTLRGQVAERKYKLQTLTARLKKEYAATQTLLADCARFNRMLLKSVFQNGPSEAVTYSAAGTARRQADTVFMNMQF